MASASSPASDPNNPNNRYPYRLDVLGEMIGTGTFAVAAPDIYSNSPSARGSRLNIGSGGVFSPGAEPGDIVIFTNLGRFDFTAGSRVVMDVDMDSADGSNPFSGDNDYGYGGNIWTTAKNSDVLYLGRWSTQQGTLVLNNIGSSPFVDGTLFKLFKKPEDQFWTEGGAYPNVPLNTDHMPSVEPALPGLGLQWDLSNWRSNGVVRVVTGGPTTPPTMEYLLSEGTLKFTWPSNYIGWEMFVQTNELDVGLTTNWTPIPSTVTETNYDAEIAKTNPAVFYKLDLPVVTP